MAWCVRIVAAFLLALFAAGTVVHTAGTTNTFVAMSSMDEGDMDGCKGCLPADEDGAQQCAPACTAPFAATLTAEGIAFPADAADAVATQPEIIDGLTGPPEPHPPRTLILG